MPVLIRGMQYLVVFLWMLILSYAARADEKPEGVQIDPERLRLLSEIKDLDLGELIGTPLINIHPVYGSSSELSSELKGDPEYNQVFKQVLLEEPFKLDDAFYLRATKYLDKNSGSDFKEWLSFIKADALLATQLKMEKPQWSFAIDEFELAVRSYPMSELVPRALYQLAFMKLGSGLYPEALQICDRAISEYADNRLASEFHLLKAEQYFRTNDYKNALSEFSLIIRKYPKSEAAVEAAFRRSFILFKEGKYSEALKTYRELEQYHSEVFKRLSMEKDPTSDEKLLDRIYFGESLYLTSNFSEASNMFQNLANLFPNNRLSPILWIRFADTFFARGRPVAALRIYQFIRGRKEAGEMARAVSSLRTADTFFLTKDVRAQEQNDRLYDEAYHLAEKVDQREIMAISRLKKALFYLSADVYPKAKDILEKYKSEFSDIERNKEWVNLRYTELVEREILDHYRAHDYLAALAVYLVKERDKSLDFRNIEVLLKLSEAARSLSLYSEAERILNKVIYLESDSASRQEALLSLVDLLIDRGELKKASERLRRFNFAYPKSELNYLYEKSWGDLYRAMKSPEKALNHYEQALKSAERNPAAMMKIREVLIHVAELDADQKLPLKSIEAYQKFVSLFDNKEAIKLGTLEFNSKDSFFVKVSQYRIADLYFDMQDYVRALRAYIVVKDEIKEEPFRSQAQYRIGECYLRLDDRDAALKAFKEVSSEDPNNLWLLAAQSYIKSVEMEVKNGIRIFN